MYTIKHNIPKVYTITKTDDIKFVGITKLIDNEAQTGNYIIQFKRNTHSPIK